MNVFEVPNVSNQSDISEILIQPVLLADYMLTALFNSDTAQIYSERRDEEARMVLCSHQAGGDETMLASIPRVSLFRALLARFGHHYLAGQLHGGFAELELTQDGQRRYCAIYMANDAWRGYWLRIYSKKP